MRNLNNLNNPRNSKPMPVGLAIAIKIPESLKFRESV